MSFTSFLYLLFFLPGSFLAYTIAPKSLKRWLLLAISIVYYFLNSKKLVVVLFASVIVTYFSGIALGNIQAKYEKQKEGLDREARKVLKQEFTSKQKKIMAVSVLLLLGALILFKYSGMIIRNLGNIASLMGMTGEMPVLSLGMPLGISFYTLQAIGYLVDVYRGKYPPSRDILQIALFLSFFPQMVEGPIGRFDITGQSLAEGHSFDYERMTFACQRILWGLFKAVVIADRASLLVEQVFDSDDSTGLIVAAGILIYTLQIYTNFSGSIDIVMGTAELFGVELSENFNQPFKAKSVNDFWQRWHITLGSWLRDYVFYSLSMSKMFKTLSKKAKERFSRFLGGLVPAASALFFVWLANGFWHGASGKYVAYGMYYYIIIFLGMLFEPLFQSFFSKTGIDRRGKGFSVWQTIRTFVLVNFGMLIFRADTLKDAFSMFTRLFQGNWLAQFGAGDLLNIGIDGKDWGVLILGTALLWFVGHLKENGHSIRREVADMPLALRWIIYLALFSAVLILGAYGEGYETGGFIYAQF